MVSVCVGVCCVCAHMRARVFHCPAVAIGTHNMHGCDFELTHWVLSNLLNPDWAIISADSPMAPTQHGGAACLPPIVLGKDKFVTFICNSVAARLQDPAFTDSLDNWLKVLGKDKFVTFICNGVAKRLMEPAFTASWNRWLEAKKKNC